MALRSIKFRLVISFLLAAVPAMLLATYAATSLVSSSTNQNIARWLSTATMFLADLLEETEEEMEAVYALMRHRFSAEDVQFSPAELEAMSDLHVDYVLLRDASGKVLFTTHPDRTLDSEPLFPGSAFKWTTLENGGRELAVTVSRVLEAADGSQRSLELASWFDFQLSEAKNDDEPIGMHIFVPSAQGFTQAYASSSAERYTIPDEVAEAIREGREGYFIPSVDWAPSAPKVHFLLTPIRDPDGDVVSAYVLSADLVPLEGWALGPVTLFWGIFILGTALSSCLGYVLAVRLSRPIRRLNQGVRSIAGGDLDVQVPVEGPSEIEELGSAFNLMARRLKAAQHESITSARQERSRMLGEIALGFAHEIRNPLVVIKTSAELVHNKMPETVKEYKLLRFIVEEVGRIDDLISEFLAFAKPAPLKMEPFHLWPLVQELAELSAAKLQELQIRCTLTNTCEDDIVLGEQNQIRQVILNLMLNAMQAMPEGGELALTLENDPEGGKVCLQVTDNGSGIPEELLSSIHLPFISTRKNGLGLGLAKVHAIMEEHGGSVTCQSTVGQGTVFTLRFTV